MQLFQLITRLELEDPNKIIPIGFNNPHSYRGYYDELAFEPAKNITVGEMLKAAKKALNSTYTGYKGGEYVMYYNTDIYLANWGECGTSISFILLEFLLGYPEKIASYLEEYELGELRGWDNKKEEHIPYHTKRIELQELDIKLYGDK